REPERLKALTPLRGVKLRKVAQADDELADSSALEGLTALDLGGNRLSVPAVGRLFSTAQVASLTRLSLPDCHLSYLGAHALAHSGQLARLNDLDLRNNREL